MLARFRTCPPLPCFYSKGQLLAWASNKDLQELTNVQVGTGEPDDADQGEQNRAGQGQQVLLGDSGLHILEGTPGAGMDARMSPGSMETVANSGRERCLGSKN